MKKTFLLTVLLTFFFCAPAFALTLNIGGVSIDYEAPQGFVPAMDGPYAKIFKDLRKDMPKDLAVHALFVPAGVDAEFRKSGGGLPQYLLITSTVKLDNTLLSQDDFRIFKEYLFVNNGRLDAATLRDQLAEALQDSEARAKAGQVLALGCFADGEYSIAFMGLLAQSVSGPGDRVVQDQALVTTSFIARGKMISVAQYRMVHTASEALEFQAAAQGVVESMGFKLGGAAQSSGVFNREQAARAAEGSNLDKIITIGLGLVFFLAVYGFLRSRKGR